MKYWSHLKRFTQPSCNWYCEEKFNRHLRFVNTVDLALNPLLSVVELVKDSVIQSTAFAEKALEVVCCTSRLRELIIMKRIPGSQDWMVLKFHLMLNPFSTSLSHSPHSPSFREVHFILGEHRLSGSFSLGWDEITRNYKLWCGISFQARSSNKFFGTWATKLPGMDIKVSPV